MTITAIAFVLALTPLHFAQASDCGLPTGLGDAIARLLLAEAPCPREVFAFRQAFQARGGALRTALVANRGFHNPAQGSFSIFETVTGSLGGVGLAVSDGDVFFGHFTARSEASALVADQSVAKGSLMIEAFAWDPLKGYYNFYELRGDGRTGRWFYRGDSADILADNALLHRQPNPASPKFGSSLRCSACHLAGGPIMKELSAPHNDWWSAERGLKFGGLLPEARLKAIFAGLVPASRLAQSVVAGLRKLEASPEFRRVKAWRSLPEALRPLFCPVELNLASDQMPSEARQKEVRVPSGFFADARLYRRPLVVGRASYEAVARQAGTRFPETGHPDADHAWLAPVKAKSDRIAIDALIEQGVIDLEFAADVLAVDFTNPVFSKARCQLLKLLPERAVAGWRGRFVQNLSEAGTPQARELLENLTTPTRTLTWHRRRVARFLEACQARLKEPQGALELYALLLQRRKEIAASEISANPRGQILEPGFRVIFPESAHAPEPGRLVLDEHCRVGRMQARP